MAITEHETPQKKDREKLCRQDLLQRLSAELAAAKRQCHCLLSQHNQSTVVEQVNPAAPETAALDAQVLSAVSSVH